MNSKSDPLEEPKDRTKLIWVGVIALIVVVIALLWVVNARTGDVTQVRAKHVLIKFRKDDPVDRARAHKLVMDLRERLQKGESFSKLAKDYSDDEMSAARGGDLGYYPRNSLDPAFEEYVWSGPVGELSDVIQSSYGFHLIIIVDRHVSKADEYEMELEKKAKESLKPAASDTPAPSQ
jgi:parvulin-like peptidyl-prolyl isomerase